MAFLIVKAGQKPGSEHRISGTEYVLGRHADCDLSELFVGDPRVSRRHAKILQENSVYYVEDLDSHNGTTLNGLGLNERKRLSDGDRIKISTTEFTFYLSGPRRSESGQSSNERAEQQAQVVDDARNSSILARADVSLARQRQTEPDLAGTRKLHALLEMLRNLGTSFEMDVVLDRLLDGLTNIFPNVDRAFVGLKEEPGDSVIPRAVRHGRSERDNPMIISRTIVQQVMSNKQAILCSDVSSDERFVGKQSIMDSDIRSFMCAPLLDAEGEAWGLIQLDSSDQFTGFSEEDLHVLAGVAPQAGIAVKQAQVHERELRQRTLIHDLEVAKRVQQALLPAAAPSLEGYRFYSHYESARHIGGDYYDYVPLPDGRLAVIVADVAGKGVSAALLMAKLSGELKTYLQTGVPEKKAIDQINQSLAKDDAPIRMVTMVLAAIDPNTHQVELVNAGHVMPLLKRSSGGTTPIGDETCGVPLGIMPEFDYEDCRISLEQGDTIVFVTDGITEAGPSETELYGLDRLTQKVENVNGELSELGRQILAEVAEFAAGRPQSDDTCLLCVKRVE